MDVNEHTHVRLSNITLEHALFVKVDEEINLLYPRSPKGEGGILFYVRPSVRPRYFSSHFSQ